MYWYLISFIFYTQLAVSSTAICRQTNDHKNYTCDGFKFREFSVSSHTRKQISITRITDCKETAIRENEKGLIFPNLHILKISCGGITEIDENAFVKLNHLEELSLRNNSLSSLSNNVFKPLNELQILDLSANKFEAITNEMFSNGPANIAQLNLSYNSISTVMPKTFNKLSKLAELFLNNNDIGPLTTGIFDRILNIRLIDLSWNHIQHLNTAFFNTRNLKFLNLSHNSISDLPSRAFHNTHLEVIDLSSNTLGVVYEDAFKWSYLQELYLQNNNITFLEITGRSIASTPLKRLDLRNNKLVFLEDGFIKKTTALVVLQVDNNPWDCGCYEKMRALRGALGLQVSTEHQKGMASICVLGENNNCVIDRNSIQSYYTMYLELTE